MFLKFGFLGACSWPELELLTRRYLLFSSDDGSRSGTSRPSRSSMSPSNSMTSSDDESYDESISWPDYEDEERDNDKSKFRVRVIDVDGGTHEEQQHITYY